MAGESPGKTGRGRRLGKYEVLEHIATGGMGAVYKARDPEHNRFVALKVLAHDLAAKPNILERFRREARSAAKLRHENIVAIYDCGEIQDTFFLALEFVDGVDLHHYVCQRNRLSVEKSREILLQTARGLAHAHSEGIIHRDIKPANILIARQEGRLVVKLTDLGLARAHREEEYRVTRIGSTVGTLDYMSPEQARDSGKADARSDLYSLGCTLFFMLTGDCPFPNGSLAERVRQHASQEPPDIRKLRPDVPAELALVLSRLLRKQPADRFQSTQELLNALAQAPAPPPNGGLRPGTTSRRGRRTKPPSTATIKATQLKGPQTANAPRLQGGLDWRIWSAIVGALGAVVVILLVLLNSGSPPSQEKQVVITPPPPVKKNKDRNQEQKDRSKEQKDRNQERPVTKKVEPEQKKQPIEKIIEKPLPKINKEEEPFDRVALQKQFLGAFAEFPEPPKDAATVRISKDGEDFQTLAEVWAELPPDRPVIIEIHDQGPLSVRELPALTQRRIWLRAAAGFRPLLKWEVDNGSDKVLLAFKQGELILDGLDVVFTSTAVSKEPAILCRVDDGSFAARNCSFSCAQKSVRPLTLVQLDGKGTARMERCFGRGASLTVAKVTGASEVLVEGSLFFTTEVPLLEVSATNQTPVTVRVIRSTLIAGQTLLRLPSVKDASELPLLQWFGWDALLAHCGPPLLGDLVGLRDTKDFNKLTWTSRNCVFAGWDFLKQSTHSRVLPAAWPKTPPPSPAEVTPESFNPLGTPVAFAASWGPGPVGCELARVPHGRTK